MQTNNEQRTKIIMERANLMLENEKINYLYQSFKNKEEAEEWLINAAIATLVIPVNERSSNYKHLKTK